MREKTADCRPITGTERVPEGEWVKKPASNYIWKATFIFLSIKGDLRFTTPGSICIVKNGDFKSDTRGS
jgi:hypothetical protein